MGDARTTLEHVPSFVLETRIAAPSERCFDLSLSVDAHIGSMSASGERAVAGVTSGVMGAGETVTWRARHFGVRIRMTSQITAYERPARFIDQQITGPFARWWHEHEFVADGDNTLMIDRIAFAAPLGVLGRIAERLVLDRYMRRLILERNAWLKRELEQGA